jgi:hypothetical protein
MWSEVLGEWDVIHQKGHIEKRKKDKSTWAIEEIGDVEADIVAGGARSGAKQDEGVLGLGPWELELGSPQPPAASR